MNPDWQGRSWAPVYDRHYPALDATAPMLRFLEETFPAGSEVLEIGVGTGRVALPLAESGRKIVGVDISEDMLAVLRGKPNSDLLLDIVHGSVTELALGRDFDGAFAVFNTFYALDSQQEQLQALQALFTHIRPGGCVVIENSNPVLTTTGFTSNQAWGVQEVAEDRIHVMAGRHNPIHQKIMIKHLFLGDREIVTLPAHTRYIWPSELTLMASLTGFEMESTYGDWDRSDYRPHSPSFISVLTRPRG